MADGGTSEDLAAPVEFEVRLPGPIDAAASLELFRRSGDDLIDRWDGTTLLRTLPAEGGTIAYACTPTGTIEEPAFRVTVKDPSRREEAEQAMRSTFIQAPPEFSEFLRRDRIVARLEKLHPGVRQVRQFDLLAALVRCISAQQVNLGWADDHQEAACRSLRRGASGGRT